MGAAVSPEIIARGSDVLFSQGVSGVVISLLIVAVIGLWRELRNAQKERNAAEQVIHGERKAEIAATTTALVQSASALEESARAQIQVDKTMNALAAVAASRSESIEAFNRRAEKVLQEFDRVTEDRRRGGV